MFEMPTKLFTFAVDASEVAEESVSDVRVYLYNQFSRDLPDDWCWAWRVTVDGYGCRGALPKRIAQYMKKHLSIKLDNKQVAQIGNLAASRKHNSPEYHMDFTPRFNWAPGRFGDHDSCFWTCNADAKDLMQKAGCYAARFYSQPDQRVGYGIARCWLAPFGSDRWVAFNGYGGGFPTSKIAHILSQYWQIPHRKVRLTNNGKRNGMVYINGSNNGGGVGYLFSANSNFVDRVDLSIGEIGNNRCDDCGDREASHTVDHGVVCSDCYDYYFTCSRCDSRQHEDYCTYLNDNRYCEHCIGIVASHCEHCCESVPNEDYDSERDMCGDCAANTPLETGATS